MQHFQGIIFVRVTTYWDIFKFELVYLQHLMNFIYLRNDI